jgi:nitroreductase
MQDVEAYDKERFGFNIENFIHTVKFRRSIRQYKSKPIERERLERIIQAGRYTATGANRQACQFVVIQDELTAFKEVIWSGIEAAVKNSTDTPPNMLTSLRRFTDMRTSGTDYLFRDAPAVVYIAAESTVDAALAAQNMEMAAIAQGLGVLFNGFLVYAASMNPAACEWLEVKNKPIAVCMLMGYPRVTYQRTAPRREADVRWL